MAFELFTKKSKRSQTEPRISISKQGQLHLNVASLDAHFAEVQFAQLLFDPETRQIAVRPADAKEEHVYKLCRNKQKRPTSLAQAFLKSHRVPFQKTASYAASWDEEVGALVFDTVKRGGRSALP